MDNFSKEIKELKFKYTFRTYQEHALKEAKKYLDNGKLNIVAAPGAGKTVLALQLIIELQKPAIIFVPTIMLCQQWKSAILEDFEGNHAIEKYISTDLSNPNKITIATYQALFSFFKNQTKNSNFNILVDSLKLFQVETMVLDEAHHLNKSWFEAVHFFREKVGILHTISLTATPPYDLKASLWNAYIRLCGEVDLEISIPELVSEQNLAPHQDFIFMNCLSKEDSAAFKYQKDKMRTIYKELLYDPILTQAISIHPMIISSEKYLSEILREFDYYNIMLKYLASNDSVSMPGVIMEGISNNPLTMQEMSLLFTKILIEDKKNYKIFEPYMKKIENNLNAIGAIFERKVDFKYNHELKEIILNNASKMKSVLEIIEKEYESLKHHLKLVVIAERIHLEAFDLQKSEAFNYLGVIPLFLYLSKNNSHLHYIVLTGNVVVIPTSLINQLYDICDHHGISQENIYYEELLPDFKYSKLEFYKKAKKEFVSIITELFEISDTNVLIGTSALIGEGWNAPFLNSLIMASTVSSFVSSNQVRGRAIRIDPKDKEKVANIWHLLTLEEIGSDQFILGKNYDELSKRFELFEAISLNNDFITTGINRMDIDDFIYTCEDITQKNMETYAKAMNRIVTKKQWQNAIVGNIYTKKIMVKGLVDIETIDTLKHRKIKWKERILSIFNKHKYIFIWPNKELEKVYYAILDTFVHLKILSTQVVLKVDYSLVEPAFLLENASYKEKRIFEKAVSEFFHFPENPRYMVMHKNHIYQIPSIIDGTRGNVEFFVKKIWKYGYKIIYTRNPEGYSKLFEIRMKKIGITVIWKKNNKGLNVDLPDLRLLEENLSKYKK